MLTAMATPSTAAVTTANERGILSTPTPRATSDSPSATMTMRPCRSAKWTGLGNRHPEVPVIQIPV